MVPVSKSLDSNLFSQQYVPVTGSVTPCVCWYVALIVITTPFLLQVTVVAGPPVEVQVKDLVVSLYTNEVAVGTPEIMGWILLAVIKLWTSHSSYTRAIMYTHRGEDLK